MKVALINPPWDFEHSIYFGCREPHFPLELGSASRLLEDAGHLTRIIDAPMLSMSLRQVVEDVRAFRPDMTVVTTAPTYLFWRCAPPELKSPQQMLCEMDGVGGIKIAVGPHASTTPRSAMKKLPVDFCIMGECEEAIARLASGERNFSGLVWREGRQVQISGAPIATSFHDLPALKWDEQWIAAHHHHHHRFDAHALGPGAEVEASRGCPYHCSFCAKEKFRDSYRRRKRSALLEEINALVASGVEYIYFIDEIFLPDRALLEVLCSLPVSFGVQTRIDLWKPDMLELLGKAGCVSIEAGIESLSASGRRSLDKSCRLSTDALTQRLLLAKQYVPFVQGNLIATPLDDDVEVQEWRNRLREHGVWANDPVPLFPYPGSPDYTKLWGQPDDTAWERAVDHYLATYSQLSDIQVGAPLPLHQLERDVA